MAKKIKQNELIVKNDGRPLTKAEFHALTDVLRKRCREKFEKPVTFRFNILFQEGGDPVSLA